MIANLLVVSVQAGTINLGTAPIDCVPGRHWFKGGATGAELKWPQGVVDSNNTFRSSYCKSSDSSVDYCDETVYLKDVKCDVDDCWMDFGPEKCQFDPATIPKYTVSKVTDNHGDNREFELVTARTQGIYGDLWNNVKAHIYADNHRFTLDFSNDNPDRFALPGGMYPRDEPRSELVGMELSLEYAKVNEEFGFKLQNVNNDLIMELVPHATILEEGYIQLSFLLNTKYINGLGQHMRLETFRPRTVGTRRMMPCFTRDDVGLKLGNDFRSENLYGCHPVFLFKGEEGKHYVFFAENSSAQEFEFWAPNDDSDNTVLTWRTIGGTPKVHIFGGKTELEAISIYLTYVGKPFMPPYYAFGHQQSKYGYMGLQEIKDLQDRMEKLGVPIDIQTFDIDYMRRRLDFSVEERVESDRNYAGLPDYIKELKNKGQRAIMMFDPAISMGDTLLGNDQDADYGTTTIKEASQVTNYASADGVFIGGLKDNVFIEANPTAAAKFDDLVFGYRPGYITYNTDEWFTKDMEICYKDENALNMTAELKATLSKTLIGKVWPYMPYVQPDSTCDAWVGRGGPNNTWTGDQVVPDAVGDNEWKMNWDWGVAACSAPAVFPDFTKTNAKKWWKNWIKTWKETYDVGGYWIDMNEPHNFVHGSVGTKEVTPGHPSSLDVDGKPIYGAQCINDALNYPKFKPQMNNYWDPLYDNTLCMDAEHTISADVFGDRADEVKTAHTNVHSVYGLWQGQATKEAIDDIHTERSFVFGRSTFAGAGRWMGNWTGDNVSNYESLRHSIFGIADLNLFGIPFSGADICGFFDDSPPHLCYFWHQLGAFYPFSRNHNCIFMQSQDAASFGPEFAEGVLPSMKLRYRLNPFLYSLFKESNERGTPPVRTLYQNFPDEFEALNTHKDSSGIVAEREFMWGDKVLFAMMVEDLTDKDGPCDKLTHECTDAKTIGDISYPIHLPGESGQGWYHIMTKKYYQPYSDTGTVNYTTKYLQKEPAIFLRADTVLITKKEGMNNEDTRANQPFEIYIAVGPSMLKGRDLDFEHAIYWDNGSDQNPQWSSIKATVSVDSDSYLKVQVEVEDKDKYLENENQSITKVVVFSPDGSFPDHDVDWKLNGRNNDFKIKVNLESYEDASSALAQAGFGFIMALLYSLM